MRKLSIRTENENGIALLLVLWIITLFAVICTEFSSTMRTETVIVRNYKDGEQAYYTAEAGINRAIIELERASKTTRQNFAEDEDQEEPEFEYWEPGGGPYVFNIDPSRFVECIIARMKKSRFNILIYNIGFNISLRI